METACPPRPDRLLRLPARLDQLGDLIEGNAKLQVPRSHQPVVLLLFGQGVAAVVDVVDVVDVLDDGVLLWVAAIATPAPPAPSADARAPITMNRRTLAPPADAMGPAPFLPLRTACRLALSTQWPGDLAVGPRYRSQIPMSPAAGGLTPARAHASGSVDKPASISAVGSRSAAADRQDHACRDRERRLSGNGASGAARRTAQLVAARLADRRAPESSRASPG